MESSRKSRSIFRTLLLPLLLIMVAETALLLGSFAVSGVNGRLNQNARDILDQQVENRRSYLESSMVGTWSDLTILSGEINAAAQALLDDGTLSLEALDRSSDACAPLVQEISDALISNLYAKKASGIFVIFNTRDLDQNPVGPEGTVRTGIYIRDLDPTSAPSFRNADLLLERAPIAVVRAMDISTDSAWQPLFTFQEETGYEDLLYQPFQTAYLTDAALVDCGYWTTTPYLLAGDDRTAISYSIPLVLDDGTVYGVLGVELLTEYLRTLLPPGELFEDKQGSYLLAVADANDETACTPVLASGPLNTPAGAETTIRLETNEKGQVFQRDGSTYYAAVQPLTLYNSNAPFSGRQWMLIGAVETEKLYAFSGQVAELLLMAALVALIAGVIGCVAMARRLTTPVRTLSSQVEQAQRERGGMPQLTVTGITEIDRFAHAISSLSRDVVDSSTRFLRIMDMASVALGGFELRHGESGVFVTDNFFPLLGRDDVDRSTLDAERFAELLREIHASLAHTENADGSILYRVLLPQGGVRYLRVEVTQEGGRSVGLAEDTTAATLERLRIEHERDYDLLTGLFNRRAFQREAEALFAHPKGLGHAAVVMLDLDNLKSTNDRFGHDWGDQYIRRAGQCFASAAPPGTLCARVSGDEFYLLYHGYGTRGEIRAALAGLTDAIRGSGFTLPDGDEMRVSASGGVAWYPDDSTELGELMRFADFAMYQVKQSRKGELADFDLGVYNREAYLTQNRREFRKLVDEGLVDYHFQPIVDAATGQPVAYEALMRVNLPTLRSPEAVLRLAREEGHLDSIERLTWYKAAEAYQTLRSVGAVPEQALLFLNSIANQCMSERDRAEFHRRFADLQPRIVVEITESEHMDADAIRDKRGFPGFSGMFALDDYGSGYNSEKNLLELSPRFIKVDISIIRGIDTDADKQQIVANIVGYAHERGMSIIAEGLETAAEVSKTLELGVDLLQGYYLARPAAVPPQVSQAAVNLLRSHRQEHGK